MQRGFPDSYRTSPLLIHVKTEEFPVVELQRMKYPVWIFLFFTAGLVCDEEVILKPVAAKSSPSHIIATKGSTVWLYWNYTYIGNGRHDSVFLTYKKQIVGFKLPLENPKALARRIGQNGVLRLESPVPAPFTGRVQVISSNSTLVIHDLQFNDALYEFSANVTVDVDIGAGPKSNLFRLLPNIHLTVYGTPSFTKEPPKSLDVNEYSNLLLDIYMTGNPKPTPYFKWSHLHQDWSGISPSFKVRRFSYVAKYELREIDGSYCGRTLQIELKNSIGSSKVKTATTVTVLLKLDKPFHLKVKRTAASKCIEVKWMKLNSGACIVRYAVALKSSSGEVLFNMAGINIGKKKICNSSSYNRTTEVQLTVSFKGISKVVTAKVSETPNNTSVPHATGSVLRQVHILKSDEASSSSPHIVAIKGSTVWLHWSYNYFGDGQHGLAKYKFREEVIGFSAPSQNTINVLAKRIGQNGVLMLQSPTPAPFNGRIEVISSNSTLVIHNLQFNDSTYQFSSNVTVDVDVGAGPKSNMFPISPKVVVTVHGAPSFTTRPQAAIYVKEGSNLLLKFYIKGNPKPSVYFKWPHLGEGWSKIFPIVQAHPFVYFSIYKLNEVDGSHCGRTLLIKITNGIGSPPLKKSTHISVKLMLDRPFDLKARKIAASKCIEVNWKKVDSGACNVSYAVALKSASGKVFYNKTKYNIGKRRICSKTAFPKITDVQLTVSFKGISKVVKAKVSEAAITTSAPTTTATIKPQRKHQNGTELPVSKSSSHGNQRFTRKQTSRESSTGITVGLSLAAVIVLIAIIIAIVCFKKYQKRKIADDGNRGQSDRLVGDKDDNEFQMEPRTSANQTEAKGAHRRSRVISSKEEED